MSSKSLINIGSRENSSFLFKVASPFVSLAKRFFCVDKINDTYVQFLEAYESGTIGDANFFAAALRFFDVKYEIRPSDLDKIPKDEPLMVVANHPFGVIDGLILGAVLSQVRPDLRIIGNEFLCKIEPLRPTVFGVDVFGGSDAKRKNTASMKQALKWLKSGGCVATFPSGTVSHFSLQTMMVVDPAWSEHICELAMRSGAKILPLYIPGRNSLTFQAAGMIHPILRTGMLGRELFRARGNTFSVRVGQVIRPQKLVELDNKADATQLIRLNTYILRDRENTSGHAESVKRFPLALSKKKFEYQPIVPAVDQALLIDEVETLDKESLLFEHGTFQVYICKAEQIPCVLREIGRLREITFRAIGEGTGSPIDLDEFDPHYLHLFIWNNETCEIVGSYRMGLIDEILDRFGKKGLYLSTLFKLKDEFLDALNPGIELGRSFVRIEYQRKQATLSLLWKGVGAFIGRNPQYARLIGGVSITAEYSPISKDLMVQFLKQNRSHPTLSKLVKARHPHRFQRLRKLMHESVCDSARTIEDVSALISEVESDRKGIPVLLKHYLRLNGVLLSFNRDPKFSDVVDGLILVDLEQADPHILKKHIGQAAWEAFNAYEKRQN